MRRLITLLFIIALAPIAYSQTVAPLHNEHTTKAGKTFRGEFQLQNNQLVAEPLVLEAYELTVDSQKIPHYGTLPPTTKVTLSTTSTRLSPKRIFSVNYKIQCQVLPCAVAILNSFSVAKTLDGIEIKLVLPFLIYAGTDKHPRLSAIQAAVSSAPPALAVN